MGRDCSAVVKDVEGGVSGQRAEQKGSGFGGVSDADREETGSHVETGLWRMRSDWSSI